MSDEEIAISDYTIEVDVKEFGAKGDGIYDDTSYIQKAFDYADSLQQVGYVFCTVVFPMGHYVVSNTLVWKNHHISGSGVFGTRIDWKGGQGIALSRGGSSNVTLKGIFFYTPDGFEKPSLWLDLTLDDAFDFGDFIDEVYFDNTSLNGVCIKCNNIVNVYMNKVRFSYCKYCVYVTVIPGSFARVMTLSNFTLDTSSDNVNSKFSSLFYFDFTGAQNTSSINLEVANGRVEGDTSMNTINGFIIVKDSTTIEAGSVPVSLSLQNVAIQYSDNATNTTNYLVYQDNRGPLMYTNISVNNCLFSGMTKVHGGKFSITEDIDLPSNCSCLVVSHLPSWFTNTKSAQFNELYVGSLSFNKLNILTGTTAPTVAPLYIGADYVDTKNKKVYKACGLLVSDWKLLN